MSRDPREQGQNPQKPGKEAGGQPKEKREGSLKENKAKIVNR